MRFDRFSERTCTMIDVPGIISHFTSITGFTIAMPLTIATYYQSFKTRQEARDAREGKLHSMNCLEFVTADGNTINLIPLETLHSLPRPGDVVLLAGDGLAREICTRGPTEWKASNTFTRRFH